MPPQPLNPNPYPSSFHHQHHHHLHHRSPNTSQPSSVQQAGHREAPVFYFENYPENWNYINLQQAFLKFGIAGRVSLARKRNIRNKRFGFFRPNLEEDIQTVKARLNTVSIGYYRIKAFDARYPTRVSTNNGMKGNSRPIQQQDAQKQQVSHVFRPSVRDSRSFVQVLKADPIVFNPTADSNSDFSDSLIITVRHIRSLLQVSSFLQSKGVEFVSMSFLGGADLILRFCSKDVRMEFETVTFPSLMDFFICFKPLDKFALGKGRFTWLNIVGIPFGAWEEEFFMQIGNYFGDAIVVHPMVISKERLDTSSVLICTIENCIQESITMLFDGKDFCVRVSESDLPIVLEEWEGLESNLSDDSSSQGSFSDLDKPLVDENLESVETKGLSAISSPAFLLHSKSPLQEDNHTVESIHEKDISVHSHSAGFTPANFMGFIETRRKHKRIDSKGNLCSGLTLPGSSESSFSNAIIRHRSKLNFAASNRLSEARNTWNIGLKLGLFSADNEAEILDLLSRKVQQDFTKSV